jgi:hypothetical protein
MQPKITIKSMKIRCLKSLCIALSLIFALVCFQESAKAQTQLLYTVTNQNEMVAVNVVNQTVTTIGITQDNPGGLKRRIRGLAYDESNDVMYGMTREGDLVTVNRLTGQTTHLYSIINSGFTFWSGLAFDGVQTLYTANAFGNHDLFKIVLSTPTSVSTGSLTVVGPTAFNNPGGFQLQILGLEFFPPSAPLPSTYNGTHPAPGILYGSNRNNMHIAAVSTANGVVTFPFSNHTMGVNNPQEIAFDPDTGDLYTIHDHSQVAVLSVYDFKTGFATKWGDLPFGIIESVGGGNDTYGWGGLTFAPNFCVPPPGGMVAWYPFDEPWTAGSALNTAAETINGNNGAYLPASPDGVTPIAGKVGWALNFDGKNDYVEAPDSPATNFGAAGSTPNCDAVCRGDFSIDAWIRLPTTPPQPGAIVILDKRDSVTARGYHFFIFGNQLGVQLTDTAAANYLSASLSLRDGRWHHVAVTVRRRDPDHLSTAKIRFYDNGVLVTTLLPSTVAGSLSNNSPLRIGTRTSLDPFSGWFKGDIDELEIFNRELTSLNISQIFQADYFGKCKN